MKNLKRVVWLVLAVVLVVGAYGGYSVYAQNINYAESKEIAFVHYVGYIQFRPSYKTKSSSGYYLKEKKHVKRAYVNYTRDGKSVTTNGGRLYTGTATSSSSNTIYSAKVHAWDAMTLSSDDRYVTHFNYGWYYF